MLSALTFWNTMSLKSAESLDFYLKVCFPLHFEVFFFMPTQYYIVRYY